MILNIENVLQVWYNRSVKKHETFSTFTCKYFNIKACKDNAAASFLKHVCRRYTAWVIFNIKFITLLGFAFDLILKTFSSLLWIKKLCIQVIEKMKGQTN